MDDEAKEILSRSLVHQIERLRAQLDEACEAADIIERLEAELATERERADARRKTVSMLCRENAKMEADRDKAEAERDALRALLSEGHAALSWMLLEGMDEVIPKTLPDDYRRVCETAARIDTALNKE